LPAIHYDVVDTFDLCDAVDWKAEGLVDRNAKIEKHQGHNEHVDERRREKILRSAIENPANDARFRLAVNLANGFIEFNAFARDSIKELVSL
jgi:hypothetical protein